MMHMRFITTAHVCVCVCVIIEPALAPISLMTKRGPRDPQLRPPDLSLPFVGHQLLPLYW